MAKIALLVLAGLALKEDISLAGDYDFICCADAGLDHVKNFGLIPNLAIGDFDSANKTSIEWATNNGCEMIKYPSNKNESDGELCLYELKKKGFDTIKVIGAFGGRPDQIFFNLSWLHLEEPLTIKLKYYANGFEIQSVGSSHEFNAVPGTLVSIFPFFGKANVRLTGFEYTFEGEISPGQTRTLSNITAQKPLLETNEKVLIFIRRLFLA